jgi:hypothetical protein
VTVFVGFHDSLPTALATLAAVTNSPRFHVRIRLKGNTGNGNAPRTGETSPPSDGTTAHLVPVS